MWSSSDMQGGYPAQWMLNPSTYQNVSNEEVDWASLAQQWIKMKETFPAEQVPPAPPPPPLSGVTVNIGSLNATGMTKSGTVASNDNLPSDLEGGEAPMDMDTKDENEGLPTSSHNSNSADSASWGTWNNWQHWGWGGNWPAAAGGGATAQATGPVPPVASGKVAGAIPSSFPYSGTPGAGHAYNSDNTSSYEYNNSGSVEHFSQQGYWMGGPSPYIKQKGTEWRHDGRHLPGRPRLEEKSDEDEESVPVIDAAKRKQLPAWIREGLEKMEKEKLKKQERERQQKERELELARQKELEQEDSKEDGVPIVPHSKFDSDSDESDVDGVEIERNPEPPVAFSARKSRFDQNSRPISPTASPSRSIVPRHIVAPVEPPHPILRTKEEIMQETMKKVRMVLTDILMSVTSEELEKAANETVTSMRAKAPATQHRKTPALTSLTGKLGLGIYNSDEDSDSEASENESSSKKDNGIDSDEELKERWLRRKQEFARIEGDIISKIEEQEERERRHLLEDEPEVEKDDDDDNNEEDDDEAVKNIDNDNHRNDGDRSSEVHHHYRHGTDHQVEAKHATTGKKQTEAPESYSTSSGGKYSEEPPSASGQDEHREGSPEQSDESDEGDNSSDSSDSSSQSSSSNSRSSRKRRKHSSSKKPKNKKGRDSLDRSSNKSRRKRSRSRSRSRSKESDRKSTSRRKSSHDSYGIRDDRRRKGHDEHKHRYRDSYRERSRTRDRDRSHSRDRDRRYSGDYRYHRHSPSPNRRKHYSSSSSHRRRRSTSSPESVRSSKRSSGRDKDYDYYRRN